MHPDLEHGGGALRFVVDGVMTTLEAFSYASETWPKGEVGFHVSYLRRAAPTPAAEITPSPSQLNSGVRSRTTLVESSREREVYNGG